MPKPTVYSRPGCAQCTMTKKLMAREGIAYDEINVEEDAEALAFIKDLGYAAAPVVIYGDRHWYGFRPDLVASIDHHGEP